MRYNIPFFGRCECEIALWNEYFIISLECEISIVNITCYMGSYGDIGGLDQSGMEGIGANSHPNFVSLYLRNHLV